MSEIRVEWASSEEWSDIMKMVWKTFLRFEGTVYTKDGIKDFFDFITSDKLYRYFQLGTYQIAVAKCGEEIIGMGSLRNRNFLSLLFVREDYHRQGVGSRLLAFLSEYLVFELREQEMLVNAAPGAVSFYERNGFRIVGEDVDYNGILVTPMKLTYA